MQTKISATGWFCILSNKGTGGWVRTEWIPVFKLTDEQLKQYHDAISRKN